MEKTLEILITTLFLFVLFEFQVTLDGCAYDAAPNCIQQLVQEQNFTIDDYNLEVLAPCSELRRVCVLAVEGAIMEIVDQNAWSADIYLCQCIVDYTEEYAEGSAGQCTHYLKVGFTVLTGSLIVLAMETLQVARNAKMYHKFTSFVVLWSIGVGVWFYVDNCSSTEEIQHSYTVLMIVGLIFLLLLFFDRVMSEKNFEFWFNKWKEFYHLETNEDLGFKSIRAASSLTSVDVAKGE